MEARQEGDRVVIHYPACDIYHNLTGTVVENERSGIVPVKIDSWPDYCTTIGFRSGNVRLIRQKGHGIQIG